MHQWLMALVATGTCMAEFVCGMLVDMYDLLFTVVIEAATVVDIMVVIMVEAMAVIDELI
jgi:hypothetical protein